MVALNPYVLLAFLAIAGVTATVHKVQQPVRQATQKVERVVKHVGRGVVHVVTFGKK